MSEKDLKSYSQLREINKSEKGQIGQEAAPTCSTFSPSALQPGTSSEATLWNVGWRRWCRIEKQNKKQTAKRERLAKKRNGVSAAAFNCRRHARELDGHHAGGVAVLQLLFWPYPPCRHHESKWRIRTTHIVPSCVNMLLLFFWKKKGKLNHQI